MSKKESYQQAFTQLQQIIHRLENEEIGLDDLSKEVKKASLLIKQCKEKLRDIEKDITAVLDD